VIISFQVANHLHLFNFLIFLYMDIKKFIPAVIAILVIVGIGAGIAFATSNRSSNDSEEVKIATSIFPLYDIAQKIGGDNVEVVQILPSGQSPHTFEPDVQDQLKLNDVDAMFHIGYNIDDWSLDMIQSSSPDAKIVKVDNNIDLLESSHDHSHDHSEEEKHNDDEHGHDNEEEDKHNDDEHGHDSEEEDKHNDDDHNHEEEMNHNEDETDIHNEEKNTNGDHSDEEKHKDDHEDDGHTHDEDGVDPHYWLSFDNSVIIATNITNELVELDPENEDTYRDNLSKFEEEINQAKQEAIEKLDNYEDIEIITFHSAFGYLAEELGIEIVATIEEFPGQEPSPEYLTEVGEVIDEYDVQILFKEPQLPDSVVEALADDYNAQVETLDPIGGVEGRNSIQELLMFNVDTIISTLE
jgi:zinc transport system substrate-binding protein